MTAAEAVSKESKGRTMQERPLRVVNRRLRERRSIMLEHALDDAIYRMAQRAGTTYSAAAEQLIRAGLAQTASGEQETAHG